MAELTKVAETSRRGLEPVNPKLAGQYDQIVALLTRRLGPDHAFLFAEPVPLGGAAAGAADTAWYCKGSGTARPLSDLPPPEAAAVQAKLAQLLHDVETLAEEMQSEGDASRELGRLLRDALVVPDDGRVWVVDGRPVLVDWGNRPQAGGAVSSRGRSGLLAAIGGAGTPTRSAARTPSGPADEGPAETQPAGGPKGPRPPEAPPAPPPPPRRGRWLAHAALWIVFAALTLASAVRLLEACALGPLWPAFVRNLLPSECASASVNRDAMAANDSVRLLDEQIRRHEIALGAKAAKCGIDCRPVQEVKKDTPPPKKETKVEPPKKEEPKKEEAKREEPIVLPPVKEEKRVAPVIPVVPDRKSDVVVGPGPVVVGPTVADVDRRVAVGSFDRGRVEVTLAWDGPADLDLRVTCPDRKEIYFRETSNCGGRLVSKDLGVGGGKADARQVEHIAWTGQPDPTGAYTVRAQLFKRYSETRPAIPYTIVLRLDGNVVQQHVGQLSKDGQIETAFTFNAPLSR